MNKLFVKLSKCSFGLQQIEYLGHIVSGDWVAMDQEKIQAMWPIPQNVKKLKGILGLKGHQKRFIKKYLSLIVPFQIITKG